MNLGRRVVLAYNTNSSLIFASSGRSQHLQNNHTATIQDIKVLIELIRPLGHVFRPNGTFPIKSEGEASLTVMRGPIVDEVHQQLNVWIYQASGAYVFRPNGTFPIKSEGEWMKYINSSMRGYIRSPEHTREPKHAEVEFNIGPIPVDDGVAKEIIAHITTALKTNKTFYTDSNGRDFIKRVRDYREDWDLQVSQPVAGNYYHVQGKFYIIIDLLGEGAKWRRTFGQEVYSPLLLAFTEQDGNNWLSSHVPTFSAIDPSYSLPNNIAMITLQDGRFMVTGTGKWKSAPSVGSSIRDRRG